MKINKNILSSDLFIISLIILLINDFILKQIFGNWITGKLSDFAGLFIFPLFWSAIFPSFKKTVHFITLFLFVFWKTSLSQDMIIWFNQISIIKIHRIIDYTDFIAVISIYFSYKYYKQQKNFYKISPFLVGIVTIFSFCASSVPEPSIDFNNPQYVIYKLSDKKIFSELTNNNIFTKISENEYNFDEKINIHLVGDSLLLVEINGITTDSSYRLSDDFQQAIVKRNLANIFLRNISFHLYYGKKGHFSDEIIPEIRIIDTISISTSAFDKNLKLNFKKSLLSGSYQKIDNNTKEIISGNYIHGVENGTWIGYDEFMNKTKKIEYLKGEVIRVEYFNKQIVINEKAQTRSQLRLHVKISIAVFCIFALLCLGLLIYEYVNSEYEIPIISNTFVIVCISFIYPFIIMLFVVYLQHYFRFLCKETSFSGTRISLLYTISMFIIFLGFFFSYKPTKFKLFLELFLFMLFTILTIDQIRFILNI